MKLRIRGDSVRVRLTQTEVVHLAGGGKVEQVTSFSATARLITSVEMTSVDHVAATFDGTRIAIVLPERRTRQWAESSEISIEAEQDVGGGEVMHLLVEKDFQCLHSKDERIADAYPNPREA